MLKWFKLLLPLCCLALLSACGPKARGEDELLIGTISGPESDLMREVVRVAKAKYKLNIQVVEFEDYILPNAALAEGSIDANMFQHLAYLENTIRIRNFDIQSIGKTFIYPMGIYSKQFKALKDLPIGTEVAIPNDPSNGERALLLLEKTGLITLGQKSGDHLTLQDIQANSRKLRFRELDAAQLPRALDDIPLAAINTNYAIPAGLMPTRDALFIETKSSPYANIVVVRSNEAKQEKYQQLMAVIQSQDILDVANKLFAHQAIPAW